MTFDQAFIKLMRREGGYSNNPADPGGPTNWGVTQAVARNNGYAGDMRDFDQTRAMVIYRKLYWDAVQAEDLPESVRYDVFDGAVNSGPRQSVRWLQQAVGAQDDGIIGPQTIALAANQENAAARYNGYRLKFMATLTSWPAFSRGWAARIANNLIGD